MSIIAYSHSGTRATVGPLRFSMARSPFYEYLGLWYCCAGPIQREWCVGPRDPIWIVLSRVRVAGAIRSPTLVYGPLGRANLGLGIRYGASVWWWVEIPA